jgi:hypothetical protein
LKKFIVHINDSHQGGTLFTPGRILWTMASGAVEPDDPGAWGSAAKGGKELLPCVQRGPTEVQTAKFQWKIPEFRAAKPEGDGKSQGTGPQVQDTVPRGQGEFQRGEQAAEAI